MVPGGLVVPWGSHAAMREGSRYWALLPQVTEMSLCG